MRGLILAGAALVLFGQAIAVAAQVTQPEPLEPPPPDLPSVSEYSLPPGDESEPAQEPAQGPAADEVPPPEPVAPTTGPAAQPASPIPVLPIPESLPEAAAPPEPDSAPPGPSAPDNAPAVAAPATPEIEVPAADSGPAPGFSFDTGPAEQPAGTGPPQEGGQASDPVPSNDIFSGSTPLIAGLVLLLASGIGWLIWRRRRQSRAQPVEKFLPTEPLSTETQPAIREPNLGPLLDPLSDQQEPASEPPEPEPEPAAPPAVRNFGSARPQRWGHLKIEFVAESASSTLINALISYRIILTNEGGDRLSNLAVSGAMAQAEKDIAVSDLGLAHESLHELPSLASGQSVTCKGQLRLPLTAIRPIAFKSQALFIPLARFAVEYLDGDGEKQRQAAAFVVGREYEPPRRKMAPFRLDLGPGSFSPVGQRALGT